MSDLTMRVILFADGHRGSATQIHQIVEHPHIYVIARRESRGDPFRETFVVGPPTASGLDVMRKQGMTEFSTLAEALAAAAPEAPVDPEFSVVVDSDQEDGS